jgi:hypothetical protein
MEEKPIDTFGYVLIGLLLSLLIIAGFISYQSIDFQILQKLEATTLVLPTPIVAQPSPSSPSATNKP